MTFDAMNSAIEAEDIQAFKVAIDKIGDVDAMHGSGEWPSVPDSALNKAIYSITSIKSKELKKEFLSYVLSKSNSLKGDDSSGAKLINKMAKDGDREVLEALVEAGVDPNSEYQDDYGKNHPLIEALRGDHFMNLICLLELGASPENANKILAEKFPDYSTLGKYAKFKKAKQCGLILKDRGIK